jgi:hypothetical protein
LPTLKLFLGTPNRVYIVDKTEGNPATVAGHRALIFSIGSKADALWATSLIVSCCTAAWASEYDLETNTYRPMDIVTNSFCAGGTVLGNGTWLNVGGNQPVIKGGGEASSKTVGEAPYFAIDGAMAVRYVVFRKLPCDGED